MSTVIKAGSYCPICKGMVLADCRHDAKDFSVPGLRQKSRLEDAAPDLLESLEGLLSETCLEPGETCSCVGCERLRSKRQKARAAIAKAKGGAA